MGFWDCDCLDVVRCQRKIRGGALIHGDQCQRCGGWSAVKKDPAQSLPWFRPEIAEEFKRAASRKSRIDHEIRDGEWRDKYNAYLESPEWQKRRRLVLQRDNYLCQACRLVEACEVHHLTYQNLGNEPLWELTSVCHGCHMSIHGRDAG